MRILIADDHFIVRYGTYLILKQAFDKAMIDQADSISNAMCTLKKNEYDILLLDIVFPEGNIQQVLDFMKIHRPSTKILIFSGLNEETYAIPYFNRGIDGYLEKQWSENKIIDAITTILNGGKYMSETVNQKIVEKALGNHPDNPLMELSNREIEVARYLIQGKGNLEIGKRLNLQSSTISTYKNRIFNKLGVKNVVELIMVFGSGVYAIE